MNIVLLGPQGSGKGTQADLLVKKFNLNHFEAGKILRSIAASDNPNATMVEQAIDGGGLVPDELVRLIAWDFITKHQNSQGFIFDGYPRSVSQYEHLQDMLARFGKKIDWVINMEISKDETIRRLAARRTYVGGELVQRDDDKPEAIARRLIIYRSQTHPVFDKSKTAGIGLEINGEHPIDVIHQQIVQKLHG